MESPRSWRSQWMSVMAGLVVGSAGAVAASADAPIDFNRDIRPILSGHCLKCHGPDESRKADLRLDQRESATGELPSGSVAIVPGSPDESELVARILTEDPDLVMPPPAANKPLNDAQKSLLRAWVAAGAEYRPHWAFVAPQRPALPPVKPSQWPIHAIDHFILARLNAEGLEPTEPADRYALARRVSLDLVGLPPALEEVEAFVQDTQPDAYERLVERLLASPHYGERWARRWLDLARYADTNGYEKDRPRTMWLYRDWVINALNADMPFDQFTIEQVAGDMLPGASLAQRIATGFHRNTMVNEEGGIDPLEFRFYALVDRVATTGTVWLGLSLNCTQCHTHKYDPFTRREFYQLMAFFDQADEPTIEVPSSEQERQRAELTAQTAALENRLPEQFPGGAAAFDAQVQHWIDEQSRHAMPWTVLTPMEAVSNLPTLDVLADGSVLASGDQTKLDIYTLQFQNPLPMVTAIRIEALTDPSLPAGGPGRVEYEGPFGDFFLSELQASADGQSVAFGGGSHDFADGGNVSGNAVDGNTETGWSINGGQGRDHRAVFPLAAPLRGAHVLSLKMFFEKYYAAAMGRVRVSVTDDPRAAWPAYAAGPAQNATAVQRPAEAAQAAPHDATGPDSAGKNDAAPSGAQAAGAAPELAKLAVDQSARLPANVLESLVQPATLRTPEDRQRLARHFALHAPELAEARKAIEALRSTAPRPPTALVMRQRRPDRYRQTQVHHRGEYLQAREPVQPAGLSALHSWPEGQPRDRLALARWLVDRRNPLTARVVVNRHWEAFFGRGLVRTTEEFGSQGETPSHPELLDWLAVELMESGWSIKHLHRSIVTSAAYRQSSRASTVALERDPANKWLSRGPRFRLEAELVRDAVLRVSGLLSPTIGGPSVYPPQPAGITEGTYGGMAWKLSEGDDRYRRGLYTFAKRTASYAMFSLFDAPSGEQCISRRDRSNTALQALTMLNDEVQLDAARALGRQIAGASLPDNAKAGLLWYRCLGRPPAEKELAMLLRFFQVQHTRLASGELDANQLAGEPAGHHASVPVDAAAWTLVSRAVLNLDAFVTKE